LTHVINLQLSRYGGEFTVILGVIVPEVPAIVAPPEHCCIHIGLGHIGPEQTELWWKTRGGEPLVGEILLRLTRDAAPFFERLATREKIVAEFLNQLRISIYPPRVLCAAILAKLGRYGEARALFDAEIRGYGGIPGFVEQVARNLGMGDLLP
jgi:hypothetical protein